MKSLLVAAIMALASVGAYAGDAPEVGKPAPDFTAITMTGQTVHLAELLKQAPVVLWFSNFCDACQAEFPRFAGYYERWGNGPMRFIVVSTLQDDTLTVKKILSQKPVQFPVILDAKGKLCDAFGSLVASDACPMTNLYVIDQKGICQVSDHFPGPGVKALEEWMEKTGFK